MDGPPRCGDVIRVDGRASVQFAGRRALILRVTRVSEKPTYYGWCWLAGYVLDPQGEAVEKREIFVQPAGLVVVPQRRRPQQFVASRISR
jgi:hypothetical protein